MARAKISLSNFTGHYPAFTGSWEYFCIAQFFRFWGGLLAQIVASHLSCAVFGSCGGERRWCLFCGLCLFCFLCCIDWSSSALQEDSSCRFQVKDNWCRRIRAIRSSWTQRVPSMYLLHLASMLFSFCLLFHYVENYRHCYTSFVNSLNKIMWNTEIAFNSVS